MWALLGCAVPGLCVRASAAILTVTNAGDSGAGSLRQALADAGAGDSITFSRVSGPITLTSGTLEISRSVTVFGPVFPHLTINGNGAPHVFHISGGSVVLSGLVITGGNAVGGNGGGVWRAVALSVGPDGVSHILWNNPDGRVTLWYVNPDAAYGVLGAYGPYADGGGLWRAVADSAGP